MPPVCCIPNEATQPAKPKTYGFEVADLNGFEKRIISVHISKVGVYCETLHLRVVFNRNIFSNWRLINQFSLRKLRMI